MVDKSNDVPLVQISNLVEVVHLSGDVSFWTRSLTIGLEYPQPEGGIPALAALSRKAAERAELLHFHLNAALHERDKK